MHRVILEGAAGSRSRRERRSRWHVSCRGGGMSTTHTSGTNILAAIDYSECSTTVIERAVALARIYRPCVLHILHVDQSRHEDEEGREGRRFELLAWLGARLPADETELEGVSVVAHEASGDPWRVIVQLASDLASDLIVLGTHGRKGLQRMMMGSVAEAVSRHAGCSVLVERQKVHHRPLLEIEPPCGVCVEARLQSQGAQLWCHDHTQRQARYAYLPRGLARKLQGSFGP